MPSFGDKRLDLAQADQHNLTNNISVTLYTNDLVIRTLEIN
jgi:hypothetical protein